MKQLDEETLRYGGSSYVRFTSYMLTHFSSIRNASLIHKITTANSYNNLTLRDHLIKIPRLFHFQRVSLFREF